MFKRLSSLTLSRKNFVASALRSEQNVIRHGLVYDADDVFRYILAKAEGRRVTCPTKRVL